MQAAHPAQAVPRRTCSEAAAWRWQRSPRALTERDVANTVLEDRGTAAHRTPYMYDNLDQEHASQEALLGSSVDTNYLS